MKIGTLIKENIGGLIFVVVLVVIMDIMAASSMDYGAGRYIALNLLAVPVGFLAWVIGNAIRKAVHPDFVIASGFWGLVKEKIFWRIGPQLILALIVLAVFTNWSESTAKKGALRAMWGEVTDGGYGETEYDEDGYVETEYDEGGRAGPEYLEITREQFIEFYAKGKEFVETDVSKLATMIKRGNKYLKVTGTMTDEYFGYILAAETIPEPVSVLDLSAVQGWDNIEYTSRGGVSYFHNIEAVIFGSALTIIPNSFFRSSFTLQAVYLPDSITNIGYTAFNGSGITEIVIPTSVTEIGDDAFKDCRKLRYVYFSENSRLTSIKDSAFSGCESLYSIAIPASLKTIGWGAFGNGYGSLTGIKNITIPADSQLETVGERAFAYTNMTSFTFPKTIKEIGLEVLGDKAISVVIKSTTPPKVENATFPKTIKNIYVPAESLKVYEDAWFDYEFTFNGQLKAIK